MPLTPFDIVNLNRSMADLGDTFRQRRLDQQMHEDQMRRELIQQQMATASEARQQRGLTIEEKRLATEQAAATKQGEGRVDVYLKGQNGGAFHFTGPKSGYDSFVSEMQKNGNPVTATDQPLPKAAYGSYKFDTDNGSVELSIENPEQLNAIAAKAKEMGGRLPPKTAPLPAAGIQYENQASAWEQQAQQLQATDPDTSASLREAAQRLRAKNNPPIGNTGFQRVEIKPVTDPMGNVVPGQMVTNRVEQTPLGVPSVGVSQPKPQGKVRMLNPQGAPGLVPAEQVEAAKAKGYRLAPQ